MNVTLLEATTNPEEVICRAARNDYSSEFTGTQTFAETMTSVDGRDLEAKQRTLISHLLHHGHFGPFEHPTMTIAIEGISRACMAQLTRHRHASFDVQSMRYVAFDDVDPEALEASNVVVTPPSTTDPDWISRNQSGGSVDDETVAEREAVFREIVRDAIDSYQTLLSLGMPPEDARFVLPIGTTVNVVTTLNARTLMHVADMRGAGDAQWEIRELTDRVLEIAAEWCPITFEYYADHLEGRKNRLAP